VRAELRVLLFSAVFVGGVAAIYWFTSYEDAGTTMLTLGAVAYAMLLSYLYLQTRELRSPSSPGGDRPSDDEDPPPAAEGSEVEIGYFPASSVWPPALGMGAVLTALGLVFGFWFIVIGAIFFAGAIIGYAVEAQAPH
jgi:hypothetical protein